MLKTVYILLFVPVSALLTVASAAIAALLVWQWVGPVAGAAVGILMLIFGFLVIVEFIAVEVFNRPLMPWLSWLPHRHEYNGSFATTVLWTVLAVAITAALFYGQRHG